MSETQVNDDGETVDQYGNPLDGSRLIYCCFPDCGCDGERLCSAERGPNCASNAINIERGSLAFKKKEQP